MHKKALLLSILFNVILVAGIFFLIQKLGGLNYMLFKMKNRGVAGVYEHRKDLFTKLPMEEGKIVFLGNSITAQCEWSELFGRNDLLNRGIPGDMTIGILERLPAITKLKPSKIFLLIGVNDLISHQPDYILSNYKKILNRLQTASPSTKVYIQSILPVNNSVRKTSVFNKDINTINEGLQLLAKDFQLEYIDLHSFFKNEDGNLKIQYTNDGIHLNGAAYLVWKNVLDEYIN